jgi:TetR/AcrR family transcriptional regulator
MPNVVSKRTNPKISGAISLAASKPGSTRKQSAPAAAAGGNPHATRGNRVGQAARQRILAAAERVFAEGGYGSASTARIAEAAGLPKANLHYYFGTKGALYEAVLSDILEVWRSAADTITADADPATALTAYVDAKIELSRRRPLASKIFANELLHGAKVVRPYLQRELRAWVSDKARIFDRWAAQGRMNKVDAEHLFFGIWAMTQTYADFDVQVRAVLGARALKDPEFEAAKRTITAMVLGACGLTPTKPNRRKRA